MEGTLCMLGWKEPSKQTKQKKKGRKKDFRLWITWTLGWFGGWIQPDTKDDEQAMGFKCFFKNPGASDLFCSLDGMSDEENTWRWYLAFILTKLGWLDLQLNQFIHEFSLAWLLDCSRTPYLLFLLFKKNCTCLLFISSNLDLVTVFMCKWSNCRYDTQKISKYLSLVCRSV